MKPDEIKLIESKVMEFLKSLNNTERVFYDGMQNLIRFDVGDYEATVSIDYQKMSFDVLEERKKTRPCPI